MARIIFETKPMYGASKANDKPFIVTQSSRWKCDLNEKGNLKRRNQTIVDSFTADCNAVDYSFYCYRQRNYRDVGLFQCGGGFPSNFPTAREHPYDREDYLLEGEMGQVIVTFYSQSGIGPVNLTVSSDAFTANSSLTKNITIDKIYLAFELTFNIKSGIDGHYVVHYNASNELGDVLDIEWTLIEIWSDNHKEAADALYATQDILYSAMYYEYSPMYESLEARSNLTAAMNEFALAKIAYRDRDWTGAKTHADNTAELINNAESAEKEFIKLKEEHMNVANEVNLKTIDFLGWMTYPALIIAVLAIAYIVVAIFKKIRPLPKPK